jgi:hypothetical protein
VLVVGEENTDTFALKTDDRGHEFVELACSETTNNHQRGFSDILI